jgi:hypothetical protein
MRNSTAPRSSGFAHDQVRFRAVSYSGGKTPRHATFAMIAPAAIHHQLTKAAPVRHVTEDALATVFLPDAHSCLLPDPALAILAKTAANWFAPTLANEIHISAEHGRIRVAGHVCNARPLAHLKTALLRLRGVGGLEMTVTVDALANPLRGYSAAMQPQHAG